MLRDGGSGTQLVRTARGRRWLAVAAALWMGVVFVRPAAAGTDTVSVAPESVLAVVNAGGGAFRTSGNGYRLTLRHVTPRAAWFSDRPGRDAGSYGIDELDEMFFSEQTPPNAALEVLGGRGAGHIVIVEISRPRYDARRDRLVLAARVLSEDERKATALDSYAKHADDQPPKRFGPAALFVDGASCLAPWWAYNEGAIGTVDGAIVEMDGLSCDEAQQVVAQAVANHPAVSLLEQHIYQFTHLFPFDLAEETWQVQDENDDNNGPGTQVRLDEANGKQIFWYNCNRYPGLC